MSLVPEMGFCQRAYIGVLADNGLANLRQTTMSVIIKNHLLLLFWYFLIDACHFLSRIKQFCHNI